MRSTSEAMSKMCVVCGRSCADRPRVKDPRGRYYCALCYEQARAVASGGDGEAPERARGRLAVGSDVINELFEPEVIVCGGCGWPLGPGVVVCSRCGYHRGLRQQLVTKKGVDSQRPPGQLAPSENERWLQEYSKRTVRQEYVKPIAMFVVGAGLIMVLLSLGGSAFGLGYLLSFVVRVPIGLVVLWLCSLLWIGFSAPMVLTALRLAGIYAVADVVCLLSSLLLGWLFGGAVWLLYALPVPVAVVQVALLVDMLELDIRDAFLVTVCTWSAKFLLAMAVLASLIGSLTS